MKKIFANHLSDNELISKIYKEFIQVIFFLFLRFYLFTHERHTERGRDIGRGRSRLHAGSPM